MSYVHKTYINIARKKLKNIIIKIDNEIITHNIQHDLIGYHFYYKHNKYYLRDINLNDLYVDQINYIKYEYEESETEGDKIDRFNKEVRKLRGML